MFLLELPPGGHTTVQRHLFEVITYVISGRGNTVVGSGAGRHNFEWGPTSTFAIPLNESYQLFNSSGTEPTRIAMVTSLPIVINLFHNTDLVFNLDFDFPDRLGEERHYNGGGDAIYGANKGVARHLWEANFVPDLAGYAKRTPTRHAARTRQTSSSRWPTARCTRTCRRFPSVATRRRIATRLASTSSP